MHPIPEKLIASLASDYCPICRGHKKPRQTMCAADYRRLPAQLNRDLYRRVGEGYEEAVAASMRALGVDKFHVRPATSRKD